MDQQAQIQISNNPEEELQRVLAALATVFAFNTSATAPSTSPQTREAADRYLTTFQKSSVAWIIADRLLSRESTNDGTSTQIHFFAAQTIHVKCRSDIMQLKGDTNQLNSLRESLMAHLLKFITVQKSGNAGSGAGAIVTRLAMALCSLAVQMQWDTIVTDLLTNLQQQQQGQGQGQGQTQTNQMEMMHLVLEIAQLLPEEATSDRLLLTDENMRHRFVHNLTQSSEKIFQFLLFCVSSNDAGGPSVKIKERVLQCVHSWVRNVRIPPLLLEQTQLFDWIFAILQTNNLDLYGGDMFDISVDVVIEVLRCYPSDHRENMGLVHKLVPKIMALGQDQDSPFQIAVREEEEDAMRDYCRIFTEMGESYMSLIMHHEDLNQVALVELVLACSAIPDNEIATITLFFWCRFVSCLEDMEPYEYRQLQIDNFSRQIMKLVTTCTSLLRLPEDIDSLPDDRIDDIHKNRFYVSDTLEDCCRLMGDDVILKNIGTILVKEVERISSLAQNEQLSQWHTIEACFRALNSCSRYVPYDEKEVLPYATRLIPNLPTTVSYLRTSANLLVGSYAMWFNRHAEQLQPILPFLAQGLSEPKCASSAAVAIKELCENCSTQFALGDSVLQLYDGIVAAQIQNANQPPVLSARDELEVLEGACKAISRKMEESTSEGISAYISRIVEPIGARLVQYATATATASSKLVVAEIERLTVVARFLTVPEAKTQQRQPHGTTGGIARTKFLTDLLTQCWPYLESISLKYTDFNMAEKICRLHKHCLRNCGAAGYKPMLGRLCTHLIQSYAHSRQSPYLYAASVCIAEYGKDPSCTQQLYQMLEEMGKTSFQFLRSTEDFKNHPDVVEELFFLAGRMVQCCPEAFIASTMFHPFIQCATVGMRIDHRDANRGTMTFVDHALAYGIMIQDVQPAHAHTHQQESRQSLEHAIAQEGKNIASNLILALTGELPCYRITANSGSVAGILHKLLKLCPGMLMDWVSAPLSKVSESEKAILLKSCQDQSSFNEFSAMCERFASVCSRSQKMGT